MAEFDMNALLRGGVQETDPREEQGESSGSISLDTYRRLSAFTRAHEWESLTDEDRQTALREGIQPEYVRSVGGKADGGAGVERDDTQTTDMNAFMREGLRDSRARGV